MAFTQRSRKKEGRRNTLYAYTEPKTIPNCTHFKCIEFRGVRNKKWYVCLSFPCAEGDYLLEMCYCCYVIGWFVHVFDFFLSICIHFLFLSAFFFLFLLFSFDFYLFICVLYECVHNKCYLFLLTHSITWYFIHLAGSRAFTTTIYKLRANWTASTSLNSHKFYSP